MDPRTVQNSLLEGRAVGDEAPEAPWEATTGQNGFQNGLQWPQGAPWEPTMGQNGSQNGPGWAPRGL